MVKGIGLPLIHISLPGTTVDTKELADGAGYNKLHHNLGLVVQQMVQMVPQQCITIQQI